MNEVVSSVMAASSSDESSTAPRDFHLSSSLESASRLSPNHQKCLLCNRSRKIFYCKECVYNGDFYGSSSHYSERYADKQLRLLQLKNTRNSVEDRCNELIVKKQRVDEISTKIRQSNERVRLLKLLVQEKKDKQSSDTTKLANLQSHNSALTTRLPKYEERVGKLERYVQGKTEIIEKQKKSLSEKQTELKSLTKRRIQQLVKYIFPISNLKPSRHEEEIGELDTVSALAEATRTAYIRGRWIYTDSSGELQHSIVAPTLPGSGDYSAYNVWVAENKDGVPSGSCSVAVEHNPAFSISAALTYTAQLVMVLAFYLDVRLPYKMAYSDFCSSDMSEHQFARRVARLNANVLQLCFSQNTNPAFLQPTKTLHNILQLLHEGCCDLGRQGPMETEASLANSLQQQLLADLQSNSNSSEDSDSEAEGDNLPYEWEAVPHVQCPEMGAPPQHMTNTQQATSMAGGLVTSAAASIASIWRGWTTGK